MLNFKNIIGIICSNYVIIKSITGQSRSDENQCEANLREVGLRKVSLKCKPHYTEDECEPSVSVSTKRGNEILGVRQIT